MLHRAVTTLLFIFVIILPAAGLATDVQPGIDPVEHVPPSWWDFGPTPLPADYFGPGSDPFDGGVPADASAIPSWPGCPGDLGNTSMLIQRLNIAALSGVPSSAVIDVEIVALSLVSTDPITVTYGGINPEQWDVEITLSLVIPSSGTMTIRKEHPNGGTFDAAITVQPYFTFTRVSDSTVRTLDGAGTYADLVEVLDAPWVYSDPALECPPCVSNFIPGHNGAGPVNYAYTGMKSKHTVRCGCLPAVIPTLSQWGLIAVLSVVFVVGAYFIVKRRKRLAAAD